MLKEGTPQEAPIPENGRVEPLLKALGVTNIILDYPYPQSPTGISWASPGHLDERVRAAGADGIALRRSTERIGPNLKYVGNPGVFTTSWPHWVEVGFGKIEHPSYQSEDATYTFTKAAFSDGQYKIHTLVERSEGDALEADFSVRDLRYILRPPVASPKQTLSSEISWLVRQR